MTTARLRELMDERVADVEGRDLALRRGPARTAYAAGAGTP